MQLTVALEGWLLDVTARRRSARTLRWYRDTVGAFIGWVGAESTVAELHAGHLRGWIVATQAHLAPDTQHNRVAAVKAFSRWLEEQEFVPRDPFLRVKRPAKNTDQLPRALLPAQMQAVLGRYDPKDPFERRDLVILKLVLDTGLRRGEVCNARLEDFDRETASLVVLGKGRRRRRVPLSAETCFAVWKYVQKDRPKHDRGAPWLFLGRGGDRVSGTHLSHVFHWKAAEVGIAARFHDLRHTAATWSLRAGMPKERVSRLLGHANDSITSIYEHLTFEDIQSAHKDAAHLRLLVGRQP